MKLNTIHNECCLNTLKRLPDNSIDLTITSPPYNMNLRIRNKQYCSRQIIKERTTKYTNFSDNLPIEEYNSFHTNVINELLRVSNLIFYNIQIVTGSKRSVFKMIGDYSDYLKDVIVWDKGKAEPSISQGVLNRRTELILVFEKENAISRKFNSAVFNRGTLEDIWMIQSPKSELKNHKAIFPEELVCKILSNFSNKNDIIYDPFAGTGTTAVVCKKMNRNFIGSEINNNYIDIAMQRLETNKLQPINDNYKNYRQSVLDLETNTISN
jgi:site-specific DNA-methyltransferase (adenine-specific)